MEPGAGETLCRFVLDNRTESRQDRPGALILRGNKLQAVLKPFVLSGYQIIDFIILLFESAKYTFVILLRRYFLQHIRHFRILSPVGLVILDI